MDTATVRNAIVSQLQADPDIISYIGASNVDYGLGRAYPETLPAVRIIQSGREEEDDFESGDYDPRVWAWYKFYLVCFFTEDSAKDAEDYESLYDRIIRKALTKNYRLGGVVTEMQIGRTFYRSIPERKPPTYSVIIELAAKTIEQVSTR